MKAVFFDLDDTLYDQLWPFRMAFDGVFPGVDTISVVDLFTKSREYSDRVFAMTESGEMPLNQMHRYRMVHAFQDLGRNISDVEADEFQRVYKEHQYKISLIPKMKRILQYLYEKNIPMYITTNGPSAHQRAKIKALDIGNWIPEANIFISSEIHHAKPDKEYFDYVTAKTNFTNAHSYMIGDSFENDILGATRAGWNAIWINTKNKEKPHPHIQPEYEVISYKQLEELIKQLF
ncbi:MULTISPECIES: HAD family hydrolase [Neobacillus]|uniref:HAD family hydrolase n=1 Tax=Neobacillus rhizophilus TaxID=2833579 RepID=A0A942YWN2_9BACI|nr:MULTISPECIES: HAD family hydrolase [Neobacillus]MBS4212866.1 HAD family hydrolase [Neobacillus rhizophilus]MBU8919005.1 HAD family hydrolase [Bacillus sp. FJAT-29953]